MTRLPRRRRAAATTALYSVLLAIFALLPGAAVAQDDDDDFETGTFLVQVQGPGGGTVTQLLGAGSGDLQIGCSKAPGVSAPNTGRCRATFDIFDFAALSAQLQATPAAGSEFLGWSIVPNNTPFFGCGNQPVCTVPIEDHLVVTANFGVVPPASFSLSIQKQGSGAQAGSVVGSHGGINCTPTDTADCSHAIPQGTALTLTATPGSGGTFTGWGGACQSVGTNPQCVLDITANTTVTATFTLPPQTLGVSVNGQGGVSSNVQPGISCPTTCQGSFGQGTQVVLGATPRPGFNFTGWSGACTGAGNCTVTMNSAQTVTAAFAPAPVQASMTSARVIATGSRLANRVLDVVVNAQEQVNVSLRVQRAGRTLITRNVAPFTTSQSLIAVPLSRALAGGPARVQITFTNGVGTKKTQSRPVTVPPPPR